MKALAVEVAAALGDNRVLSTPEDLIAHGYDGTWLEQSPALVVVPQTTREIQRAVEICARREVPIVPRGAGSGLAGGAVPSSDAVVISTTRLQRIVEIDRDNCVATVEAGVVNAALQRAVEEIGLFYPPDPASLNQSTIGGNVATSASGPRCLKYGGTKDYVVGIDVVLPTGELIQVGGRSPQPSADHYLLQLFVGSEGTLGIVGQVTVRLLPKPAARGTVMATFRELDTASEAVGQILAAGIVPLALELMDKVTLACVESYLHAGLPTDCEALLLVDVDGLPTEVARDVGAVAALFRTAGASDVQATEDSAASQQLWRARRSTSSSFGRLRPNKLGEDISVPRAEIPSMVRAVQAIARERSLLIPLFGHIGDGNLHPNILCDLRDTQEMARVAEAAREIFAAATTRGGTLSGEHGIGRLKRSFLASSIDPGAHALLTRIKASLDPRGVFNPGKVI